MQKQAVERDQRYYEAISAQMHGAQLSNEPSFLDFNEEQENEINYGNTTNLAARSQGKRNNQTMNSQAIRERLREQIERKKQIRQQQRTGNDYLYRTSTAAKKQSPSMLTNITTLETLKRIDS